MYRGSGGINGAHTTLITMFSTFKVVVPKAMTTVLNI